MVLDLILRVWLVIRAAHRNPTIFVAARGSSRPSRPLRPSQPKNLRAHTRRKPTCSSRNLLLPRLKIVHFGPDLALRISGSNLCEKVGNPGIPYEALQLMTGIWGMVGTNNPTGSPC
jgi:hypothetical protein